ncbi:hypothetical protein HGA92_00015 [Candidatus Gracilibacteria bacterium]|nr:hypothetical protein [Candidatus Gracilibacteria bacterium]NUJ99003.1 hypothetical protein [Candidatus Gracilibacteria bacterium]
MFPDNIDTAQKDSPYLDIYKNNGKYLVLKISGSLLDDEKFKNFVNYVKFLREKGVSIILVYGGGDQITETYEKNTGKTREKGADGNNPTSKELIDQGVIPAYEELQKRLGEAFGEENINLFEKEDIICERVEGLGEVGVVKSFKKEFDTGKINILPFVGVSEEDIKSFFNVNADDIVTRIVGEMREKISNIIFLTGTGGVEDNEGNVISFLTKKAIEDILDGKHLKINATGGMKKKLKVILEVIEKGASKVSMTNIDGIKEEIEGFGSGTMVVDLEKVKLKKLESREMFDFVYESNVKNGNWKERNEEEKDKIFENYQVLELEGTILGGYVLCDTEIDGKKGKILECIFSSKERGGIGTLLLKECIKNKIVFTYSKKGRFFKKNGFVKVEGHFTEKGVPLYKYEGS